ncbi:sensor histidine kinase [Tessaracoccus antarcticus]|uniref:histidine kinase n=1 Tax=Tessaracoccus antarcticus TaxID=2479848 RepID=A0A3M0FXQ7_9ACTN|nr:histidine kinase [Tessaracoccus antarcticus]RMB57481.1 ATPase [Tessaracoccus antarcticus]
MMGYGTLAVTMGYLSSEPPHATDLWSMVLLGLCGMAVLAGRRRHPRMAFAGVMVLSVLSALGGSAAECILPVIAVFVVGVRRPASTAWLGFVVALASGALMALVLPLRGRVGPPILGLAPSTAPRDTVLDWANSFFIIAVTLLVATLLGTNLGHRRRHIRQLTDRADRLAKERDQQAEIARSQERERIAREMHDVIAHSLSVMIAMSDGAHACMDERPSDARDAVALVSETGRKTLGEVRRLLGAVRDDGEGRTSEHGPQPDASQLLTLVTESVAAGLPACYVVTGTPPADPALELTVYRIVQESLTNVLRHARHAESVTVAVTWTMGEVTIVVDNTTSSATQQSSTGRGIPGMRERVALYDGVVQAGPHGDGGWRVFARLRWEG